MISNIVASIFRLSFLQTMVRLGIPILLAATSSYIATLSGIGNIAVEGIMSITALCAVLGSYIFQNAWLGLLFGLFIGIVVACGIAFFSMKLGASSSLVGIALNTFADSITVFILYIVTGDKGTTAALKTPTLGNIDIPIIKDIPILGEILSGYYVVAYIAILACILFYIVIYKTPFGMRMRACGLNPEASRTAGIDVNKMRVISLIISGFFAALGGVYLSLCYAKLFSKGMVSGQGWMGIAADGIANGNYLVLILATVAFSVFRSLSISFMTTDFPSELTNTIPYIAVFTGIVLYSITTYYRTKKGKVEKNN